MDEVYVTEPDNVAKLKDLFRAAMEIWLPDLPDVQLVQNYHRIPLNQTHWKNYPTDTNAYVNDASWHLTYNMVLWNVQPSLTHALPFPAAAFCCPRPRQALPRCCPAGSPTRSNPRFLATAR